MCVRACVCVSLRVAFGVQLKREAAPIAAGTIVLSAHGAGDQGAVDMRTQVR